MEGRVEEQKKLTQTEVMSGWAKGLGEWLVINPWRVLVPMAILIYAVYRVGGGAVGREFVLGLFGGF